MSDDRDLDFSKVRPSPLPHHQGTKAEDPDAGLAFEEIQLAEGKRALDRPGIVRKVNDQLGMILVAVILLAPIPLGSNRPIFWMIWAGIIGVTAALYLIVVAMRQPGREFQARHFKLVLGLGVLFPLGALAQLVPVSTVSFPVLPSVMQPDSLSLSRDATLMGLIRLSSYGLFFFLLLEIATHPNRVRKMAWMLFLGIVGHAVWALVALTLLGDYVFWGEKQAYLGVATGTFVNRNSFATFLGMGMVLGIALVLNIARHRSSEARASKRWRFDETTLSVALGWMGVLIIALALVATQSRMGIAASAAGALVVYFLMQTKIYGRPVAALFQVIALAVGLSAVLLLAFGQGVIERSLFIVGAVDTRADLYAQVAGMIAERPLFGFGLDTFRVSYELYHDAPVSAALVWNHAHNTYLSLWAEMGLIIGSMPILAVLAATFRLAGHVKRRKTGFAMPVAALGIITVGALHSLVDFSLEIQANTFLFLGVIALGLGQLRRKRQSV